MARLRRFVPLLAALAFGVAACGGSDASPADGGDLRNAEDVRSEQLANGVVGAIGETVDLDGFTILVSSVNADSDEEGPWLSVDLRVENRTDQDVPFLDIGIVCSGNDEAGGWFNSSTMDINAGIPKGSFDEGTVDLLLPDDGRYGEPIPECATPAVLRIFPSTGVTFGDPNPAIVPIPDDVVADLNNAR